jgi:hypothetical protein
MSLMSLVTPSRFKNALGVRPLSGETLPAAPRPARWNASPERHNRRVRLATCDVRGVFDNRIQFHLIDVSEGGACVETDRPLPYVTGAELRFEGTDLKISARVAWTKLVQGGGVGPRYRAGVQFLEPTFDQIRALLELAAA